MTKAQQILKLYNGKRSTREIADILGCRIEYVRVVARQRKGSGTSEIDRRHASRKAERMRERYQQDHEFRENHKAYCRAYYHNNPEFRQHRIAYQRAYYHAKKSQSVASRV